MTKSQYTAYLSSAKWKRKRSRVLKRDRHACQTCGVCASLEVHHRTYARVGRERTSDLITLCSGCHSAVTRSIRARGIDQGWPDGISAALNDLLRRLGASM